MRLLLFALLAVSAQSFAEGVLLYGPDGRPISCKTIVQRLEQKDASRDREEKEKAKVRAGLTPQAKRELRSFPQRVTFTRYNSLKGGQWTAERMGWRGHEGGSKLAPETSISAISSNDADANALNNQQAYPLKKMAETGYITEQQAREYSKLGGNLDYLQIAYVESTRVTTREWVARNFTEFPTERVDDIFYESGHANSVKLRTASMWSVSGQILDPNAKSIHTVKLPWELEPKYKEISERHFDRRKYKFVWEWGRAAQDLGGENESLRHMLASITYRELAALRGNLDDAYVMFHSLDKTNTELYLKLHPDSVFPKGSSNMDDVLFLVPLKEMLEKYKPSEVSAQLSALNRAFDGKLTEKQLMDLFAEFQEEFWQELNFIGSDGKEQSVPILFSDYSNGKNQILNRLLAKYGYNDSNHQFFEQFQRLFRATYNNEDTGRYIDASDPQALMHLLAPRNAVEASNLDSKMLERDSQYPLRVLSSLFIYYAHRIAAPNNDMPSINHAVAQLRGEKVQFAISTYDAKISAALDKLGAHEHLQYKGMSEDGASGAWRAGQFGPESTKDWLHRISSQTIHVHVFTADQVIKLMQSNPQLFLEAWGKLYPGPWQGFYQLRLLDLF